LSVDGTGTFAGPPPSPGDGGGSAPASASPDGAAVFDDAGSGGGGPGAIDAGADAGVTRPDAAVDAGADGGAPAYPSSCAELPNGGSGLDVTLYWDGDKTKPYDAHCGPNNATYVRLNDTTGKNASTYPIGTLTCTRFVSGQTKSVTTTWTMLRFDPVTHLVDTGDYAGATSAGGTHEDSGTGTIHNDYLKMPFASGRVCDNSGTSASVATIDLSKTKLAVAATQAWSHDGYQGADTVTADGPNKKLTLKIAGYSAGVSPCAANADYYTLNGGSCLMLAYSP
jgi:hypothetical protein